tara:strand:+ start:546 stop:758 length:213 start_codon:yes stop_codon:yes gene_type:complete
MDTIISGVAWIISSVSFVAGAKSFNTSKIVGALLISNAFLVIYFHNKIMNERELDRYQAEMNIWEAENYY